MPAKLTKAFEGGDSSIEAMYKTGQVQWGRPYYNNVVCYDPVDVKRIYHGNPYHYTTDGGKTFVGTTSDDHALWINPSNSNHFIWGNDVGAHQIWWVQGYEVRIQLFEKVILFRKSIYHLLGQCGVLGMICVNPIGLWATFRITHLWTIPTQTKHGGVTRLDGERLPGGEAGFSMADPNDWKTVYTQDRGFGLRKKNIWTGDFAYLDPFSDFIYASYTEPESLR